MRPALRRLAAALTLAVVFVAPGPARAAGKLSLYIVLMEPSDVDAKRFSRSSWGGGVSAVLPWPAIHDLMALTSGIEIVNMLSHSTRVYDPVLDEWLDQNTSQSYGRFFVGTRVGAHGAGFLRPHVGTSLALVWYGISTDVVIPDPSDPNNSITKTVASHYETAFGYDVNAGVDLNFVNRFPVEIGLRHIQSFNVPQPLGEGAVSVSPAYFEFYLGVGVSLESFRK